MKIPALVLAFITAATFLPAGASAAPLFHYKATALFPIQMEEPDPRSTGGTIVKKFSLGTKQLINLALGQALDFKNPSHIVLAVALDHDNPGTAKLVVYDSDALEEVTTVLILLAAPISNIASKDGDKGTGNGLSTGQIQTTTLGTPTQNGLVQTDICGAATGALTPTPVGPTFKMSATGLIGDVKGKVDGEDLEGLLIKGMFTASGKPIDRLSAQ